MTPPPGSNAPDPKPQSIFSPTNEEYLKARAVPLKVAAEVAGLRSVTGDEIAKLLNRRAAVRSDGLAIPYPGVNPPYYRIRCDDAEASGAPYLVQEEREVPIYIPLPATRAIGPLPPELQDALVVVESPIKALALMAACIDAVGLGGTSTTLTEKDGVRCLNGSWDRVPLKGRKVVVCSDAGRAKNPNVARDEARLVRALRAAGANVYVASLPEGVDGGDQGPDDFIAASGPTALYQILAGGRLGDPLDLVNALVAGGKKRHRPA